MSEGRRGLGLQSEEREEGCNVLQQNGVDYNGVQRIGNNVIKYKKQCNQLQ